MTCNHTSEFFYNVARRCWLWRCSKCDELLDEVSQQYPNGMHAHVPPHPIECDDPAHRCHACGGCVTTGCAGSHPECPFNKENPNA